MRVKSIITIWAYAAGVASTVTIGIGLTWQVITGLPTEFDFNAIGELWVECVLVVLALICQVLIGKKIAREAA